MTNRTTTWRRFQSVASWPRSSLSLSLSLSLFGTKSTATHVPHVARPPISSGKVSVSCERPEYLIRRRVPFALARFIAIYQTHSSAREKEKNTPANKNRRNKSVGCGRDREAHQNWNPCHPPAFWPISTQRCLVLV